MPDLTMPPTSQLLRLRRSRDGKVAGVCAAVADHWGVDPTLVRVGTLLLAVSGGIGVVGYLFGWVWLRGPRDEAPLIHRLLPSAQSWSTGRLLMVLSLLAIIAVLITSTFLPFGLVPMIVVAIAALIAHNNRPRANAPTTAEPTGQPFIAPAPPLDPHSDFGRAVSAWQQRLEGLSRGVVDAPRPPFANPPASAAAPVATRRAAKSPAKRRLSGWYTVMSLAAAALAWVVTAQSVSTSSLLLPAAVSLSVVAAALLVASFFGRPRFLVVPGLVLAAVVAFSVSPVNPATMSSVQTWTSQSQIPAHLQVGNQSMVVNADDLSLEQTRSLAMTVRNGTLVLDLPEDVSWTMHYTIQGGVLRANDSNVAAGWVEGQVSGGPAGAAHLVMNLDLKTGTVKIQ